MKVTNCSKAGSFWPPEHSCAARMMEHWYRLPRGCGVSSLETFRSCLGVGLGTLLWCLCWSRGGTKGTQKSLPPQLCCDSVPLWAESRSLTSVLVALHEIYWVGPLKWCASAGKCWKEDNCMYKELSILEKKQWKTKKLWCNHRCISKEQSQSVIKSGGSNPTLTLNKLKAGEHLTSLEVQ